MQRNSVTRFIEIGIVNLVTTKDSANFEQAASVVCKAFRSTTFFNKMAFGCVAIVTYRQYYILCDVFCIDDIY